MTRYFFDVQDAEGHHRDENGVDLESVEDAREQCRSFLPNLARDELPKSEFYIIACEVRDETGRVAYRGTITYEGTCNAI